METVTPERTGWRDEGISCRHREWGVACKATDVDFILVEYTGNCFERNAAIIEYKCKNAPNYLKNTLQILSLRSLSNSSGLPFFVVYYSPNFSRFTVMAGNFLAENALGNRRKVMSERDYVNFLYEVRGITDVPKSVLENLNAEISARAKTGKAQVQLSLF